MAAPDRITITHQRHMTTPADCNYRALCAEMLSGWQEGRDIAGPMNRARAALKAEPEGKGPALDHANLIGFAFGREPWATWLRKGGCLESAHCELSDLMLAVLARWGNPATPPPLPPNYIDPDHTGQDRELLDTFYRVTLAEGGTTDECTLRGLKAVLAARPAIPTTPPSPEPPADALAARPLLQQVAAMADCIGANSVGQITAISNRAAAWLRENPPGRPVAIEPRGCPTPGACSCVEPTPPAPVPLNGYLQGYDAGRRDAAADAQQAADAAQNPPAPEPPIQPDGRSGLTWKAAILGLRDVLADQTESAVQPAWQRFRILTAIDLMVANSTTTLPATEPEEMPSDELMEKWKVAAFAEYRSGGEPTWRTSALLAIAWARQQQATELAALRGVPVSEPLPTHDMSNAAPLLWLLWHHQRNHSPIGQHIRKYLGMGQFEPMSDAQIGAASFYQALGAETGSESSLSGFSDGEMPLG